MARQSRGSVFGAQKGPFARSRQTRPDGRHEREAHELGFRRVCGVDEAGRGPLAGPVVAAAVVLPFWYEAPSGLTFPPAFADLNDSKALSETVRERLFEALCADADVSIASISASTIDRRNIRTASLLAMRLAVVGLAEPAHFALIDGRDEPKGLPCAGRALVKGDARSVSIAAASICAKVARDRMMVAADQLYPAYGFAAHKGYATQAHRDAIMAHGPCPLHRRTFAPVRASLMDRP